MVETMDIKKKFSVNLSSCRRLEKEVNGYEQESKEYATKAENETDPSEKRKFQNLSEESQAAFRACQTQLKAQTEALRQLLNDYRQELEESQLVEAEKFVQ